MRIVFVRLAVLFALFFALYIGFQLLPRVLFHAVHAPLAGGLLDIASALFLAVVMIVTYRLVVRLVERRSASELGATGSVSGSIGGAVLGAGLFVGVYAILWLKGIAQISGPSDPSGLPHAAAIALASAVGEEIVFRGIFFRILEQGFGTLAAILVSSALFGLVHALNHGATWWSTMAIALEAGAMLGAAFAASRNLWLPIGIHFGWNFTEGGIFGAAVSGGAYHGLVASALSGPAVWTGGSFGPEASIVAVGAGVLLSVALLTVAGVRGQWQPLRAQLRLA